MTRLTPRFFADSIFDSYLSQRASFAESRWHSLNDEDTALVLESIRRNSKSFILQQLEKDGWQGTLMRSACHEAMIQLGLFKYPPELSNLSLFATKAETFATLEKAQQAKLTNELNILDTSA